MRPHGADGWTDGPCGLDCNGRTGRMDGRTAGRPDGTDGRTDRRTNGPDGWLVGRADNEGSVKPGVAVDPYGQGEDVLSTWLAQSGRRAGRSGGGGCPEDGALAVEHGGQAGRGACPEDGALGKILESLVVRTRRCCVSPSNIIIRGIPPAHGCRSLHEK